MEANGMLDKSVQVADEARKTGAKVFHAPISFSKDGSDNPNKGLGILAGCAKDELFTRGTWNADFCDKMKPADTDLEALLKKHRIETVAIGGFLTNCCVESTMRTAYEKGFNVITLTDCTAATSEDGQKAACEGTYGLFSKPMLAAD